MAQRPDRRQCLSFAAHAGLCGVTCLALPGLLNETTVWRSDDSWSGTISAPTHSIIPIVGDGRWIWRDPPKDKTGYLEPRLFEVRVGVEATGRGEAREFVATTVAPGRHPEQEILDCRFDSDGCDARLQDLGGSATQELVVSSPHIADRQTIRAQAIFKLRLCKSYLGFQREKFPARQRLPRAIAQAFLGDSPGIETRLAALDKIIAQTTLAADHPWDKARAFHAWVFENIRGVPGDYTNVRKALETREGDCEERAGVFIALCRAAGIPARLVWVPNHAWAEFLLLDEFDQAHWIPAHTAAYSWFGWTGAHEVVLQKGDRLHQSGPDKNVRLVLDWYRCGGVKPRIKFTAAIQPLATGDDPNQDPGPGARVKQVNGKWTLVGSHPDNKLLRS